MTYDDTTTTFLPLPTQHNFRNLTGQVFDCLTVLGFVGRNRQGGALWLCECVCGQRKVRSIGEFSNKRFKSCGCKTPEAIARSHRTHGGANTALYSVWLGMLRRCRDPRMKNYRDYGGRGIKVCERWQDFANFRADMGERPSPRHSLERIDNERGYEPSNCRWATRTEQMNNKRGNHLLTFRGKTQTVAMWARELHIPHKTLRERLRHDWTIEKALTTPVLNARKS